MKFERTRVGVSLLAEVIRVLSVDIKNSNWWEYEMFIDNAIQPPSKKMNLVEILLYERC
jgi:hypothetical protein